MKNETPYSLSEKQTKLNTFFKKRLIHGFVKEEEGFYEEQPIYETKAHWISYVGFFVLAAGISGYLGISTLWIILGSLAIGIPDWLFSLTFNAVFIWGTTLTLVLMLYKVTYKVFYLRSIRIILYQKKITLEEGVFSKHMSDLALRKMEGLNVYQPPLGRVLGYGILQITTGDFTHTYKIKNPLELRAKVGQQMNQLY